MQGQCSLHFQSCIFKAYESTERPQIWQNGEAQLFQLQLHFLSKTTLSITFPFLTDPETQTELIGVYNFFSTPKRPKRSKKTNAKKHCKKNCSCLPTCQKMQEAKWKNAQRTFRMLDSTAALAAKKFSICSACKATFSNIFSHDGLTHKMFSNQSAHFLYT